MVGAVRKMSTRKRKAGRPSKLSIEDQVLMTLMYLRENRTYFHIGHTYGINASTAYRLIRRVEDKLSKVEAFRLPGKKQVQRGSLELSFVIVDVTEAPIERPKKAAALLQRQKEVPHAESTSSPRSADKASSLHLLWQRKNARPEALPGQQGAATARQLLVGRLGLSRPTKTAPQHRAAAQKAQRLGVGTLRAAA